MASHGDGKNNKRFGVVVPKWLHQEISDLAQRSKLTVPQYIERVLEIAVEQQAWIPPVPTRLDFPRGPAATLTHDELAKQLVAMPIAAAAENEQAEYKSPAPAEAPSGPSRTTPPVPAPKRTG
jgi:hypothetical protein